MTLDAERLYEQLLHGVPPLLGAGGEQGVLVGIHTGGAWLAERLHRELDLSGEPGLISSALHRDDFAERGLSSELRATHLPFQVDGSRIVLVDDVLHTGRTIRAVVNELFDFGRPRSIALAVLVDRAGRELPIGAAFAAATVTLDPGERLTLARGDDGRFRFETRAARPEGG